MEIATKLTAFLCALLAISGSRGIELTAYISQNGLHGEVTFLKHSQKSDSLLVNVSLQPVDEFSKWSWSIREYPVNYNNLENRCREEKLGSQLLNLDDILGPIILPRNDTDELIIPENAAQLIGNKGLWGRTLLIHQFDYRVRRACGTITVSGAAEEKIAEAKFYSPIAGSVFMRWVGSAFSDSIGALVHTNLYWVAKNNESLEADTYHLWKIYATDIFDAESVKTRDSCNFLQFIFDPTSSAVGQTVGDIDTRLGKVKIAINKDSIVIGSFHDSELTPLPVDVVSGQRSLYLVIFDPKHEDRFLACAKIRHIVPYTYIALMQSEGISGRVTFSQRSPFDPTILAFNLSSYEEKFLGKPTYITDFKIHELPPPTSSFDITERNSCYHTSGVYNPSHIDAEQASGSQDTYAVGDLNGKHNMLQEDLTMDGLNKKYWDIYLPLQGSFSVAHRSLVLYRKMENYSDPSQMVSLPWICTRLTAYNSGNEQWQIQMLTAEVIFRYPIVGRVIFRQPRHDPSSDTTVIVEYLIHADGTSQNNTEEHRWMIHEFPPGRDFYNWSGRCLSAGETYNPFNVNFETKNSETPCSLDRTGYCQVGDLTHRHGTLKISGKKKDRLALSRRLFTDTQLSLSGPGSILGKSLVIYDDFGPKARGERLACSEITAVYRRKAVVKDWFGNGNLTPMKGKMEFYQQTEYDITDVEIDFEGLSETSAFHIHEAPVDAGLDFPCETSTLNGQWNPYNVTPSHSPTPAIGTTDQYQMGDLSGKVGTLDGLTNFEGVYNDSRLPLFGSFSILGRSVIIHKKEKDHSWSCSSIERGYAPSEARELRAIASFHHPLGFAYGYIRMTQLVYNDGTKSDTVIEVNLRHPGKNDRNITRNHNWAIYVNPVGVDASVKILDTRCVAGGYMWNPYYTQLADPLNGDLYREECGPDNPLRCYVGDISGRLGTIDLGVKRQVFSDVNFPLEGDVSAMGRSIVVLNKNRGSERFACANIEPDKDIIKYANIQKPPKFVIAQFIDDVREVMGVPEWMLHVDSRKTKILYSGGCIQFLLHFKGPAANQLEQDFSKLLNTGKLSSPSLYIPGYVTPLKRKTQLPYRQCGSNDPRDKKGKVPDDECQLSALKLKNGFKIMMMGSLEKDIEDASAPPEEMPEVVNDLDIEEEEIAIESREVYLAKIERRIREYQINIISEPRPGKKLLVLDIDYTLFDNRSPAETGYELMRPYLHEFLTSAYKDYDIVIWSATSMKWIEEKMKLLGVSSHADYKICFYLDSSAMISVHTPKYGVIQVKPLGVIWGKFEQYSAKNTIMFDDVRRNFIMNPGNGLKIRPFKLAHINRDKDRELLRLAKYLQEIAHEEDLSSLEHKHWEKYKPKNKKSSAKQRKVVDEDDNKKS